MGGITQGIGANPNRYALFLSIEIANPATEFVEVRFSVQFGVKKFVLAILNNDQQSTVLNLFQCGQVIQSAVSYDNLGPDTADAVNVHEAAFDIDVETIP